MKRIVLRMLPASGMAIGLLQGVLWYITLDHHRHKDRPRVYIASNGSASDFALFVAERSIDPIVVIPIDEGETARVVHRARIRGSSGHFPRILCRRLVSVGAMWVARHGRGQWPIFVGGDGITSLGSTIESLYAAGIRISDDEYASALQDFDESTSPSMGSAPSYGLE